MRIGVEPARRVLDADLGQQLDHPLARRLPAHAPVQRQDFRHLPLHRVQRVERGHRLLEHHGDVVAAHLANLVFTQRQQILAFEQHTAGRVAGGGILQQLEDGERGHRLAGAGLPDQRQRLPALQIERHMVHRQRRPQPLSEGDGEVLDGEEGSVGHQIIRPGRGPSTETRPSGVHCKYWVLAGIEASEAPVDSSSIATSTWSGQLPSSPRSSGSRSRGYPYTTLRYDMAKSPEVIKGSGVLRRQQRTPHCCLAQNEEPVPHAHLFAVINSVFRTT